MVTHCTTCQGKWAPGRHLPFPRHPAQPSPGLEGSLSCPPSPSRTEWAHGQSCPGASHPHRGAGRAEPCCLGLESGVSETFPEGPCAPLTSVGLWLALLMALERLSTLVTSGSSPQRWHWTQRLPSLPPAPSLCTPRPFTRPSLRLRVSRPVMRASRLLPPPGGPQTCSSSSDRSSPGPRLFLTGLRATASLHMPSWSPTHTLPAEPCHSDHLVPAQETLNAIPEGSQQPHELPLPHQRGPMEMRDTATTTRSRMLK